MARFTYLSLAVVSAIAALSNYSQLYKEKQSSLRALPIFPHITWDDIFRPAELEYSSKWRIYYLGDLLMSCPEFEDYPHQEELVKQQRIIAGCLVRRCVIAR